jgi:hypothetical protein
MEQQAFFQQRARADHGRAVQVDGMISILKAPSFSMFEAGTS